MVFYHGTTTENWEAIQQERMLYGKDRYMPTRRLTYLATDLEEAKCYGDVVLQVEYDPYKHPKLNNYIEGCWQFRVYEPIDITQIKVIRQ